MRRAECWSYLGYTLAQGILSVVLLIAVALKATVLEAPGNRPSQLVLRTLVILELLTEWFIAAWLMSGVAKLWSRRAAMLLLLLFVAVTSWRQAGGDPDCHCFGALRVPPLVTLSYDLITLFAFYSLGRAAVAQHPRVAKDGETTSSHSLRPLRVSFAVIVSILLPMSAFVAERRLFGSRAAFAYIIPVDPQGWRGRQFPLLELVDRSERTNLTQGIRTVVLFRHDCETCTQYLARRAADAPPMRRSTNADTRLIDVASTARSDGFSPPFPEARLRHPVVCLSRLPLEVVLKDGIVQSVKWPE